MLIDIFWGVNFLCKFLKLHIVGAVLRNSVGMVEYPQDKHCSFPSQSLIVFTTAYLNVSIYRYEAGAVYLVNGFMIICTMYFFRNNQCKRRFFLYYLMRSTRFILLTTKTGFRGGWVSISHLENKSVKFIVFLFLLFLHFRKFKEWLAKITNPPSHN